MAIMPLLKLEIDVPQSDQLAEAANLAKKHSCPALIVAPDLVLTAGITRSVKLAKFNILTIVDHPRGELFNKEKFRGFPTEAINAQGFEILLTAKQTHYEVAAEIKYLSEFCRNYFGVTTEIRFVLDLNQPNRNLQFATNALLACKTIPMPSLIRLTHHTKVTPAQSNIESTIKLIEELRKVCAVPIKVSGNVDYKIYKQVPADKFGVSLLQAQAISEEVTNVQRIVRIQPLVAKPLAIGEKNPVE